MTDAIMESGGLLEDAELVLEYGARAGRLTDDSLALALKSANEAKASGQYVASPEFVMALSKAVEAISPVTLVDLRSGRSPFDRRHSKSNSRLQFVLSVFTIALVGLIAFYMLSLQREQDAVAQLERVVEVRPLEKLGALRKMAQFEGVFKSPDIKYDQYRQKLNELLQIQERISTSYLLASNALQNPPHPFYNSFDSLGRWVSSLFAEKVVTQQKGDDKGAEAKEPKDQGKGQEGDGMPAVKGKQQGPDRAKGKNPEGAEKQDEMCSETKEIVANSGKLPGWLQFVLLDAAADFCFSLNVMPQSSLPAALYQPVSHLIPALKDRIAVKSGWVLPFLFGLLGASVFLMRSQLSTRTATIQPFAATLRVALGGVAGILVGWFGASGNGAAPVISASTIPFGLAFMAGFSIDILFSLLDRLNRAATEQPKA